MCKTPPALYPVPITRPVFSNLIRPTNVDRFTHGERYDTGFKMVVWGDTKTKLPVAAEMVVHNNINIYYAFRQVEDGSYFRITDEMLEELYVRVGVSIG